MSSPEGLDAVRELFGSDADRYDARHYGTGHRTFIGDRQRLLSDVLASLGLPPGAAVLDVACGPGHFLHAAVTAGAEATGLDRSRDMLRTSAARLGARARLIEGDAYSLPFGDGTFDLVNCSGLIEYLPEPVPMLREFRRVLKSGGRAMVSSTNRRSPALLLEPLVGVVRRSGVLRRLAKAARLSADEVSLRERRFDMHFHTPGRLAALMAEGGFAQPELHYCHLQFFPHPIDRLLPRLTTACVNLTDRVLGVAPLRAFAEGLVVVGQQPPE